MKQEIQLSTCSHHEKLYDHTVNFYNSCTDYRAWSLDDGQRRRHFFDIISRHIPHCGKEKHTQEENVNTIKPEKKKEEKEKAYVEKPEKNITKEKPQKLIVQDPNPLTKSENQPQKDEPFSTTIENTLPVVPTNIPPVVPTNVPPVVPTNVPPVVPTNLPPVVPTNVPPVVPKNLPPVVPTNVPPLGDSNSLSDEILEKLDCNLSNLESTFDKFVCKNRDFIQNLIESLSFEKQRQEDLKRNHCKVKQENDILRTKNEYLTMVNAKQVEFFKNELEKAINENKNCFRKKVQQLERVISCNKEELQYYKKNETNLLKMVENEKMELHKLKNEINNLKSKEVAIIRQYANVLNFLEDIKKTLSTCGDSKGDCCLQSSSQTISDSGNLSNLPEVLRNALCNGIESLNVRDLSVLHDCIQDLNDRLCHQNEFCGRNPMVDVTISQQVFFGEYSKGSSTEYIQKGVQDYESSLSIVPSRQGPERNIVYCPQR